MIIFDSEIKKAILGRNEQINPALQYCGGWSDYEGMGISVICAFDTTTEIMHTLLPEESACDAETLQTLFNRADYIVGFNNHSFDNKLLAAGGFIIPDSKSYDIYEQVIKAAGLNNAPFSARKGYRLDDIARANDLGGKLDGVAGALAPVLYQSGLAADFNKLCDYCRRDVEMTVAVLNEITAQNLFCPRTGNRLSVMSPYEVLGGTQASLFCEAQKYTGLL